MDCVCAADCLALDAVLDPAHSRYFLLRDSATGPIIEARDLAQGLVLTEFPASLKGEGSQMSAGEDLILANQNCVTVYSCNGVFRGSFVCGRKSPYELDRLAVSKDFLYFSSDSHSNIYACSYSSVSQLSPTRQPLKFRLPRGTTVLSMQQKPGSPILLAAACSDGLIRIWSVSTQEEEIGILDPARDIGLNKKVIQKLIKSEIYPAINAIDFTQDGSRMLAAGNNGAVNIWRTERLPTTYFLEASLRVSELGAVAARWLTSQSYCAFCYFLVAIREGAVMLLQHSISTVFNPDTDGQKLGLARMFPSKIMVISPSLLSFQPPDSGKWRLDLTLQVTSASDSFLLCVPSDSGLSVRNMRLLPSSASTELSLPVAAQLGNLSVEAMDPDKARFFPYAFYLKSNEIWRMVLATGKSELFISVSEGQVLVRNFSLSFRPHKVATSYQFLIMKDVKGKRIATFLSYTDGQISQTLFTCHDAVLLGPEEESSGLLLLLGEAQDSVTMLDLKTGVEKAAFVLQGKLLKAAWTPLAGGFAVLYETQNDHSLCLSRSALSRDSLDISLDSALRFRLRFDERVCALCWHRTYFKLCVGTSLRVAVVDHNLVPLMELKHAERVNLASMVWMGNTVLYTANKGLYYCHSRGQVKLASVSKDSIILQAANDRVCFLRQCEGDAEVVIRPVMLLEPLLLNYISLPSRDPQFVHRLIEKMDTNLVSETLVSALLREKFYSAATYLIETHGLPHVSVKCKAEAMLGARKMEELWKVLEINENDRESLRRGSAELCVLAGMTEKLEQLAQISKIATVFHRQKSDWELALLARETQKPSSSPIQNPFLHLLTFPSEPITLQPQSLTDFSKISQVFPDKELTPQANVIRKTKLGYREAAFTLKTTDGTEIFPISGETFSQWIGFDAVHEPGISPVPDADKEKVEPSGFGESPEEGKLLAYFRMDEGSGDNIADIVTGKTWNVSGNAWLEMLEDGIPMDYEDKWGKAAPPNYAFDCSELPVVVSSLGIPKNFTVEMWVYVKPQASGTLLAMDSVSLQLENGCFAANSKLHAVPNSETAPELPVQLWTHITLISEMQKWQVYFNTKLAFERESPPNSSFDTLKIGQLSGKITEIRVWSGSRSLSDIRENSKCPLDIVNEKKKKAWSGMTIKKVVAGAPASGNSGLKLQPPGKKLGLLAPPGLMKTVSLAQNPVANVRVDAGARQEEGKKAEAASEEMDTRLSEVTTAMESGEYAESLIAVGRVIREIAEEIAATAEDEGIVRLQALLQTAVSYKLALSLLLKLQSERQKPSLEAQQRAAELCNLLIQVKIKPKHRKSFAHLALDLNVRAGNYSIALKIADQLLTAKSQLTESQLEAVSSQRTICQASESRDNGLVAGNCPSCKAVLPAGVITKKCAGCKAGLRFCYLSFALVSRETATQCPVCAAVYRSEGKPIGDKCAFCALAKVKQAEFEGESR